MLEFGRLRGERGIELRMRMPMRAGPPRGDEIEDLGAVGVEQRGGIGAREYDRLGLAAMLGVGMPDMAPVACQDLFRQRGGRWRARFRIVVHAVARASLARSSSGWIAFSVAAVT